MFTIKLLKMVLPIFKHIIFEQKGVPYAQKNSVVRMMV